MKYYNNILIMIISNIKCKCGCNQYFIIDIDFIDKNNKNLVFNLFYYDKKYNNYILNNIYMLIYYNYKICNNFIKYFKIYNYKCKKYEILKFYKIIWKYSTKKYKFSFVKTYNIYKKQELLCICNCNNNFKINYFLNLTINKSFYRLFFTMLIEYKRNICYNFIKNFKIKHNMNNLLNIYWDEIIWRKNNFN
ncbi:unknown similar to AMEV049 [Mythimna separata entomopoxvirus 'L']|uniref:Uncharacterized protein n=1 Tax=Mythimna separata entomopoxvirus 'L' TaxID=1293572 RepID=A0A916KQ44_9POXV|nr:unknown similar to AMEV049 [Mythimna separata entomopoxvirus 'L']CCU56272.1 unknown similar to AMEV049 [Mythimna separata entomopoxvirus 'L']